jgi:hypothetical protein
MKEEDKIKNLCGAKTPFKVPEGYFEDFTQQLMNQLPEVKETAHPSEVRITLWQRVRPWFYMAAMFCGILLGGQYLMYHTQKSASPVTLADQTEVTPNDEYLQSIMDNALMDDYTIYCYLTDNEYE